jgi:aspartate/tyrosine/aromatic aminotransferase
MPAVKAAETRILASQTTKEYLGVGGDVDFVNRMAELVWPAGALSGHWTGLQSVGGTGACRILLELCKLMVPDATVWLPNPTWQNHASMAVGVGLKVRQYPYPVHGLVADVGTILSGLAEAKPGDIVIIHASCHNPTGVDLDAAALSALADFMVARQLVPFLDAAYLGFGNTFAVDAQRLTTFTNACEITLVAVSCSKNFSIYRERTGAAFITGADKAKLERLKTLMLAAVRASYSMPPDHGARIVSTILGDAELKAQWLGELEAVRQRLISIRASLADALTRRRQDVDWAYVAQGAGMFSMLPFSKDGITTMREQDGIYMLPSGRINIAGLSPDKIPALADTFAAHIQA